jgi:hypothetical protein
VSPTEGGLMIKPTAWQNLYFKKQIKILSLNRITLQIWEPDLTSTLQNPKKAQSFTYD